MKNEILSVDAGIFKTYDIRGICPDQINADVAYAIGRAFATLLLNEEGSVRHRVAVGSDMRLSSPALKEQLIAGLIDSGVNVDNFGLMSTPSFYFGVSYFDCSGGIQISASHNPKEWNGFKVVGRKAVAHGLATGLGSMREIIAAGRYASPHAVAQKGIVQEQEGVTALAVRELLKAAGIPPSSIKPFKIVVDTANAMGVLDLTELFAVVPALVTWMNKQLDGTFPAHPADPFVLENNKGLQKKIIETGSDLGIASDGDGDRYFFFDEKGDMVPPEILRGIMATIELRKIPGATIVYDVRPGKITSDMIRDAGGEGIVAPVGHTLIKEKMREVGAIFGGESSGHYFYSLPYGIFEAPIILITKFLAFLSEHGEPLSRIVAPYRKYVNSGEINIRLTDRTRGLAQIEKVKEHYAGCHLSTLDGLSVEGEDFRFNVRLSNTEPLMRLIVEADSVTRLTEETLKLRFLLEGVI